MLLFNQKKFVILLSRLHSQTCHVIGGYYTEKRVPVNQVNIRILGLLKKNGRLRLKLLFSLHMSSLAYRNIDKRILYLLSVLNLLL